MTSWQQIWWVGAGGFLGANARYWLGGWVAQRYGTDFPWGTLAINVSGSLVLGAVMTLLTDRYVLPPAVRWFVPIGFLGAYTTFSTFEYETLLLAETASLARALANVVASVVLGFVAIWLGARLARLI